MTSLQNIISQFARSRPDPPSSDAIMRVSYVILATLATLLASTNAKSLSTDSVATKKFTITNPDSSDAVDGVYLQQGNDKYVIIRLSGGDDAYTEDSAEDATASDHKEERAGGVSAGTATKLKKQFSGEYNTFWNKLLWRIFHKLNPEKNRIG
ncbi:hypothetical protein PC129_g19521 [Phytophthora cactorum]|nr:hypothetical protein GQ600_3673 [Phytophthora cactorum]KAG2764384.1 hypothetical protein Pcac1_g24038 [Phytophthora cactorum]KAG2799565.1 hypothetical protein PC111_g20372 [Phytophthora cactorum]KAG2831948.1 hypothetical protein PC113_g20839 [Phytophthora cactorum]KAG2880223.1 hypothetical protein PC114_g22168 [Phytophthora cactorum]